MVMRVGGCGGGRREGGRDGGADAVNVPFRVCVRICFFLLGVCGGEVEGVPRIAGFGRDDGWT